MARDFNEDGFETGENRDRAIIGPSISIKGEVSGSEDLLIQGAIEGTVNLRENTVTVGRDAKVSADIFGNAIRVDGEVLGNLTAREQVVVTKSGYVRGNITAPRLSLEDGARLKGAIDTEPHSAEDNLTRAVEKVRSASPADTQRTKLATTNGVKTAASPARDVPPSSSSVQ